MNRWLAVAGVLGAIGVVFGAFGAHALKSRLTPEQLGSWSTAVEYQLLHAVALLALATWGQDKSIALTATAWTAGIVLFSGSIYGLCLGGPRLLGPVTPIGGVALIVGWISLIFTARG